MSLTTVIPFKDSGICNRIHFKNFSIPIFSSAFTPEKRNIAIISRFHDARVGPLLGDVLPDDIAHALFSSQNFFQKLSRIAFLAFGAVLWRAGEDQRGGVPGAGQRGSEENGCWDRKYRQGCGLCRVL